MIDPVTFYQKKLKLSGSFIEIYTSLNFTSKDQFILDLLEALYLERKERIIERNLKTVRFSMVKTLVDYSFTGIQLPEKLTIEEQKTVLFYTVHSLINQLVRAKDEHNYEKLMKKIAAVDLIILDEWGYLPLHQEGARLLFEVISLCYERKSIIITTNIEFSHWKNFLFDEQTVV